MSQTWIAISYNMQSSFLGIGGHDMQPVNETTTFPHERHLASRTFFAISGGGARLVLQSPPKQPNNVVDGLSVVGVRVDDE
jgi:hypothetical protein